MERGEACLCLMVKVVVSYNNLKIIDEFVLRSYSHKNPQRP